jgi:UPF0755 protein
MKKLLIVLLFLVFVGAFFWPGAGSKMETLNVSTGLSAREIAGQLQASGVLRTPIPFLVWVRLRHASARIHAGRYRFRRDRSAFWIVDDLIGGRTEKIKVTIPEGFASWQIGERLESLGIGSKAEFVRLVKENDLEGFLFPATYDLSTALTPRDAAKVMSDEFARRWTSNYDAQAQAIHMTKKEVVTLASILEREIRVRDELPQISAVYHNRLRIHMRLDADPTVQYAFGFWKAPLTHEDIHNTESPYNTYLHNGLPPGPICSPSLGAIRAALWPTPSNALYFVAQEDGHHLFSASYRDHVNKINVRKREIKAKKAMLTH